MYHKHSHALNTSTHKTTQCGTHGEVGHEDIICMATRYTMLQACVLLWGFFPLYFPLRQY